MVRLTGVAPSRRAMLTGAAAFSLAGCAATARTPRPVERSAPCLARPLVDESRLIRSVAGLRPYRASGFVVREDAVGAKRVVHNYGHGGSGVTLSWGTARLAVELGLRGHSGPVAVLGAGVVGLSTARLVQEAGFPVTVYAEALPPHTTSNVAGGQFHPFGHYREDSVTPEWREQFRRALDYGWRRFQLLAGEDYGVRWLPTYVEATAPEVSIITGFPPVNRMLRPDEHPFAAPSVMRYDTMYVETGRYLFRLLRDLRIDGGAVRVTRIADRAALQALPETLIFNCTGLGARTLFDDAALTPIRGQLAVLLPQPELTYAYTIGGAYMFPRPDGVLLGGSWERGQEDPTPQPETIRRILESHARVVAGWRCGA